MLSLSGAVNIQSLRLRLQNRTSQSASRSWTIVQKSIFCGAAGTLTTSNQSDGRPPSSCLQAAVGAAFRQSPAVARETVAPQHRRAISGTYGPRSLSLPKHLPTLTLATCSYCIRRSHEWHQQRCSSSTLVEGYVGRISLVWRNFKLLLTRGRFAFCRS